MTTTATTTIARLTAALAAPQTTRRAAARVAAQVSSEAGAAANALIPSGCTDWVRWAWSGEENTDVFFRLWEIEERAAEKARRLA
jgi:hypothetical protein